MRCAILIIGSLFWDESVEREAWRSNRLCLRARESVKSPIEYGRRARRWGNSYTMTFVDDSPAGLAVLVPCASSMCRFEDLIEEAYHLWQVEQHGVSRRCLGADWGCVGAMFRFGISLDWHEAWTEAFQRKSSPIPPVGPDGILNIPWPTLPNGMLADFDVILGTSTRRESTRPTANMIADAWVHQSHHHERYFFENVKSGIRTSKDLDIWMRIEEQSPPWINQSIYGEAMNILRNEVEIGL
jgi:hypothetical protein